MKPILRKDKPYKNLDQLKFYLDTYSFRKTHDDVQGFPKTILDNRPLEMAKDQRELYNRILDETFKDLASDPSKALHLDNAMTKTLRLRQCLSNPILLGEKQSSIKFEYLDQLLEEILEEDKTSKVVLWSTFRPTVNMLAERYKQYGAVVYAGVDKSLSVEQRTKNEEKFMENTSDCRVLSGITSKGTGNNWQIARYCIYVDLDFRWLSYVQSKGRIERRNATSPSTVMKLLIQNSFDEYLNDYLEKKTAVVNQLMETDEDVTIDKNDLLSALRKV